MKHEEFRQITLSKRLEVFIDFYEHMLYEDGALKKGAENTTEYDELITLKECLRYIRAMEGDY